MGMAGPLILVANPGSASRKYGLFRGGYELAQVHFEHDGQRILCTAEANGQKLVEPVGATSLDESVVHIVERLTALGVIGIHTNTTIDAIGLRVVAPSSYFLQNHILDETAVARLKSLEKLAPLHIAIVLQELKLLRTAFTGLPVYGISDSAFHNTKPDYAWNYGIALADADTYDIKRFGYHGLSVSSALRQLKRENRLASKMIVAHLGSGGSVTAVHAGKSLDNTMGYSPLEGIVMASRSGTIDYSAVRALQTHTGLNNVQMEYYLNTQAGLLGLGGSNDIRELLIREQRDDERARLALATEVYSVQKAIGQMTAALGGADALVFTGTVGERSAIIRQRIIRRLHYLDFYISSSRNQACTDPEDTVIVSELVHSKPIYVVHADEAAEIAVQTTSMMRP